MVPCKGSGKSLLASCIGALVEGRAPDVWPHTSARDDEEVRKRLFTALREGRRVVIWDNVTGTLDSASMAAFITAKTMSDRVLGKSEAACVPNRAFLLLTGNNLSLAGDLPRRVVICRIDPETEHPFARKFDLDPLQWVLDNRLDMQAAACTLIRARFTHMKQPAPGRLGSFEDWDSLVRQTVAWAGAALAPGHLGDPMALLCEAQTADPEADTLFALLDALRVEFGAAEFTAKSVLARINAGFGGVASLTAALMDVAGDRALVSVKSLGRVLKFREGRIARGLHLTGRQDKNTGARVYRISGAADAEPEKI